MAWISVAAPTNYWEGRLEGWSTFPFTLPEHHPLLLGGGGRWGLRSHPLMYIAGQGWKTKNLTEWQWKGGGRRQLYYLRNQRPADRLAMLWRERQQQVSPPCVLDYLTRSLRSTSPLSWLWIRLYIWQVFLTQKKPYLLIYPKEESDKTVFSPKKRTLP